MPLTHGQSQLRTIHSGLAMGAGRGSERSYEICNAGAGRMATVLTPPSTLADERSFFFWVALAMFATAVAGFGSDVVVGHAWFTDFPWQAHVHAVVFSSWIILYVVQNWLVADGRNIALPSSGPSHLECVEQRLEAWVRISFRDVPAYKQSRSRRRTHCASSCTAHCHGAVPSD